MKSPLPILLFILQSLTLPAQHLNWAVSKKIAPSTTQYALDIKASNLSDATYVLGIYYLDTMNTGVMFQNSPSFVFLMKINSAGDTIWKWNNTINATGVGQGLFPASIELDANDNIYMCGFYSLLSNNSSISIDTFQMPLSPFYYGGFLAKFDSNGHALWVRAKSVAADYNDVDVDSYGNVYLLGNTQSSITFGTTTIAPSTSNLYRDFIASYDSSGNLLWAQGYGEIDFNNTFVANNGCLLSIAVSKGSVPMIYAAGFFLTPYDANGVTFTSAGAEDALLLKLDMNGNYVGGIQAGAANLDAFYNVAINSHGEMALGMLYRTSTSINGNSFSATSNYNTILVKMDTALNYSWAKNSLVSAREPHIDIDEFGRCAITDGNDFGVSPTTFEYLQVYDAGGTLMFSKSVTGSGSAQFSNMGNHGIVFSKNNTNRLYIAGGYKTQMTVDSTTLTCGVSYEEEISVLKFSMPDAGTTGVNNDNVSNDERINIYPNPSSGIFNFISNRYSETLLTIYNMTGEIILSTASNTGTVSLDLSQYPSGVYFAEFTTGELGKTDIQKIILLNSVN